MWSHSEVLTFLYPLIQWLSSASVVVFFHQDRLSNAMQWCHVLISAPHSNPSPFSPSLWYLFPLELLSIWNLISVFNSLQCCSPWWPGCDFPNVVWWFYSLLLFLLLSPIPKIAWCPLNRPLSGREEDHLCCTIDKKASILSYWHSNFGIQRLISCALWFQSGLNIICCVSPTGNINL